MWEQAVGPLQKAIWLNPDFSSPYILLGKVYFRTHGLEFAEGMLKQAVRMGSQQCGRTLSPQDIYRSMGRGEES